MTLPDPSQIVAVIPARYQSSRLPGKVLADINGRAMVHHVADRVRASGLFGEVIVATDHELVTDYCHRHHIPCVMTSASHTTGTDRVAEAVRSLPYRYVVNVQGDEPFIAAESLRAMVELLAIPTVSIATLRCEITDAADLLDYNVVKVTAANDGRVLYFSRQAIPAQREGKYMDWLKAATYYRHLGLYGFRKEILMKLVGLGTSTLEVAESLEQLRWLQHGYHMYISTVSDSSIAVDTEADLYKARLIAKGLGS